MCHWFYYNYGVNFNWSTKMTAWDPEHLSEMKFKVMNHPLESKVWQFRNWNTSSYKILLSKLYCRFSLRLHICCRSENISSLFSLNSNKYSETSLFLRYFIKGFLDIFMGYPVSLESKEHGSFVYDAKVR